jgi:hypothetical protein
MDHVIIIPQDYFSSLTKISKYIKIRDIERGIKEVLESKHHDTFKIQLYIQLFERYLRKASKTTTPAIKPQPTEKDKEKTVKTTIPPSPPPPPPSPPKDNSILATLINTPQASSTRPPPVVPIKKSRPTPKPYGTPRSLASGIRREVKEYIENRNIPLATTPREEATDAYLKKRFAIPPRKLISARRKLDTLDRHRANRKSLEQQWEGGREKLDRKAKNKK